MWGKWARGPWPMTPKTNFKPYKNHEMPSHEWRIQSFIAHGDCIEYEEEYMHRYRGDKPINGNRYQGGIHTDCTLLSYL